MIDRFMLYLKLLDEYVKNPSEDLRHKLILVKEGFIPVRIIPKEGK